MSKNEDYILPEGCIAIQMKNAALNLNISREAPSNPLDFYADNVSPLDTFLQSVTNESRLTLDASTLDDILMLRGEVGDNGPSLNRKNVLIIITDEDA